MVMPNNLEEGTKEDGGDDDGKGSKCSNGDGVKDSALISQEK
jgi:hypothetical protein